jgi:hypothetical protein
VSSNSESGRRRRYFWHCPRCYAFVPREKGRCECGGTKAERKRAHEQVTARPGIAGAWLMITLVTLGSFGLLWALLD